MKPTFLLLIKNLVIFFTAFFLFSCSSYRPIFEQNEKYLMVGNELAQHDFDFCKNLADQYLDKYKTERAAKEASRKAVVGGVVGAATGLIWGRGVKSTLVGSAIGAGVGAAIGGLSVVGEDKVKPDQMKQRYVSSCLAKKGYSILGWR